MAKKKAKKKKKKRKRYSEVTRVIQHIIKESFLWQTKMIQIFWSEDMLHMPIYRSSCSTILLKANQKPSLNWEKGMHEISAKNPLEFLAIILIPCLTLFPSSLEVFPTRQSFHRSLYKISAPHAFFPWKSAMIHWLTCFFSLLWRDTVCEIKEFMFSLNFYQI